MPTLGGASADPLGFLDLSGNLSGPCCFIAPVSRSLPRSLPGTRSISSSLPAAVTQLGRDRLNARRTSGKPRCYSKPYSKRGDLLIWRSSTTRHGSADQRGGKAFASQRGCCRTFLTEFEAMYDVINGKIIDKARWHSGLKNGKPNRLWPKPLGRCHDLRTICCTCDRRR